MSKNSKVVGSMSEWSGLLKDFFRQVDDGSIALRQFQLFLDHKDPFIEAGSSGVILDKILEWQVFYRNVFKESLCFREINVPEYRKDFDRLIIVDQGMTPQRIYNKCKELFPCWKWTDRNLDEIITSDRTAKDGPYAVWFRDRVEADEELKNLSANQLKQMNIPGITIAERLLFELKFFGETGRHLDIRTWNICSGSRYSRGGVLCVVWNGHELHIDRFSLDDFGDNLRTRQAVSN